jgi:hypothetical protein
MQNKFGRSCPRRVTGWRDLAWLYTAKVAIHCTQLMDSVFVPKLFRSYIKCWVRIAFSGVGYPVTNIILLLVFSVSLWPQRTFLGCITGIAFCPCCYKSVEVSSMNSIKTSRYNKYFSNYRLPFLLLRQFICVSEEGYCTSRVWSCHKSDCELTVFRYVTPCSSLNGYQHLGWTFRFHLQTTKERYSFSDGFNVISQDQIRFPIKRNLFCWIEVSF